MSVQCLAYSRCSLNVSFSCALKVQISIFSKILLLKLLGAQNSNPNPLLESHTVTTSSAYSRLQEIFFFPGNLKARSLDPRQHGTWPFLPGSLVSQSLLIRGFSAYCPDWNCSSVVVYLFHVEQKLGLCQDAVLQPCNDMASPTSLFQPFWTK